MSRMGKEMRLLHTRILQEVKSDTLSLFEYIYANTSFTKDTTIHKHAMAKIMCLQYAKVKDLKTYEEIEKLFNDEGGMIAWQKRRRTSDKKMKNGTQTANEDDTQSSGDHQNLCCICQTEKSVYLLRPCNHCCVCKNCVDKLRSRTQNCPMCRSYVETYEIVYFT